jgi:hypothetical protein
MSVVVIGIAGGSASDKTTVAKKILQAHYGQPVDKPGPNDVAIGMVVNAIRQELQER